MPGWFALSLVLLIVGLLVLAVREIDRRVTVRQNANLAGAKPAEEIPGLGLAAATCLILAALFCLVSSYNPVGTKEEGIETSFGKTVGHLSNGPHFTLPWVKVHEMDAAIQTDSYTGNDCLQVRIANQQTGCASVSIQWRIVPSAGDELYKDFRSFDHVRDALVTRKLTAAVNEAFSHFNPLDTIVAGTGVAVPASGSSQETLTEISGTITKIMRREIGNRILVLSTILPLVTFDQATQDRINQLQQQVALTRIATQQLKTNEAQAKANHALAQSVDRSPNVLVSRCLDALEAMVKARLPIPAGFSCWPGGGVAAVIASPTPTVTGK